MSVASRLEGVHTKAGGWTQELISSQSSLVQVPALGRCAASRFSHSLRERELSYKKTYLSQYTFEHDGRPLYQPGAKPGFGNRSLQQ